MNLTSIYFTFTYYCVLEAVFYLCRWFWLAHFCNCLQSLLCLPSSFIRRIKEELGLLEVSLHKMCRVYSETDTFKYFMPISVCKYRGLQFELFYMNIWTHWQYVAINVLYFSLLPKVNCEYPAPDNTACTLKIFCCSSDD